MTVSKLLTHVNPNTRSDDLLPGISIEKFWACVSYIL